MTPSEFFHKFWQMLFAQGHGPMHFRVFMQPLMASFFAFRYGIQDAREGRPSYFFWAIFTDPVRRPQRVREVWQHVSKIFLAAIILDVIYQLIVYRWIYPMQALITAVTLAFVPYLLLRGIITRISSRIIRAQRNWYTGSN